MAGLTIWSACALIAALITSLEPEAVSRQSRQQRGGDPQSPTDVLAPVMISQREEWEHKEDKGKHIEDLQAGVKKIK